MNIGIATSVALAKKEKNILWLSMKLQTSPANASRIANSPNANSKRITQLAEVFEMPVSEFIALGE